jgi:hypothetical protein
VRTANELLLSVMSLRRRLIDEGKDPLEGIFVVTRDESRTLKMMPNPAAQIVLDEKRERLCGLKLHIV